MSCQQGCTRCEKETLGVASRIVRVAKRNALCALEVLGMHKGVVSRVVGVAERKTKEL